MEFALNFTTSENLWHCHAFVEKFTIYICFCSAKDGFHIHFLSHAVAHERAIIVHNLLRPVIAIFGAELANQAFYFHQACLGAK